jgi:hypothetical protein
VQGGAATDDFVVVQERQAGRRGAGNPFMRGRWSAPMGVAAILAPLSRRTSNSLRFYDYS